MLNVAKSLNISELQRKVKKRILIVAFLKISSIQSDVLENTMIIPKVINPKKDATLNVD